MSDTTRYPETTRYTETAASIARREAAKLNADAPMSNREITDAILDILKRLAALEDGEAFVPMVLKPTDEQRALSGDVADLRKAMMPAECPPSPETERTLGCIVDQTPFLPTLKAATYEEMGGTVSFVGKTMGQAATPGAVFTDGEAR